MANTSVVFVVHENTFYCFEKISFTVCVYNLLFPAIIVATKPDIYYLKPFYLAWIRRLVEKFMVWVFIESGDA